MADEHWKNTLIVREMLMKTTVGCFLTPMSVVATKQQNDSVDPDRENLEPLCSFGWSIKWYSHFEK